LIKKMCLVQKLLKIQILKLLMSQTLKHLS
ncbi:uncharacterized protein METZ01_LOCUS254419, partial [marine metagenome]